MLTKEQILTKKKQVEKPQKLFVFLSVLFIFSVIFSFFVAIFFVNFSEKSDEEYLAELSARKEAGEYLSSGEMRDFCHLSYILRNEISPECVCVLDGINWDNPPKSPEDLSQDWELTRHPKDKSDAQKYKHKQYPKIIIRFDYDNSVGIEKPHWHRENPNSTSKDDAFLDKHGNWVRKSSKESHIYVKQS